MTLWWTTNLLSNGVYYVPTNIPTRELELRINRSSVTNAFIYLDASWNPGREVDIHIVTYASSAGDITFRIINGDDTIYPGNATGVNTREWIAEYDSVAKQWSARQINLASSASATMSAIGHTGNRTSTPRPVSVEEWLELYQGATD